MSLKLGDYHEFQVFCIMVQQRRAHGKPANYLGIDITADEFDDFDGSNECLKLMMAAQPMPTFAQPPPGNMSTTQTELVTFQKGIKRDASLFPVIKQDTEWDSWNRSIVSLARAQAIEQVLDSTYTPILINEISLFEEKQKYMYAVFARTMQTDKGKAIVRAHETTFDAQKVYKEMHDYCVTSTKALMNSSTLLAYITTAKFGDGTWKSGAHKFVLHWEEQVRQYEALVPPADHFGDTVRLQMLQNAVFPVKELRAVKNQADQLQTQLGKKMTYNEYVALLSSSAIQYDGASGTSASKAHKQ
jgi:hypothetical protein